MSKYIVPPKLNEIKYFFGFTMIELGLFILIMLIGLALQSLTLFFLLGLIAPSVCRWFPDKKNLIHLIKRRYNYISSLQEFTQGEIKK